MSNAPKPNAIDLLRDEFLMDVKRQILDGTLLDTSNNPEEEFVKLYHEYIVNSECFELHNLDQFQHKEIITGCHHYIDGILISNGNKGVQVLEHDYKYYERLDPVRKWAVPGQLTPEQDLIIATPFPGYLGLHPEFDNILKEAEDKNINVHLDCAWLSCSNNIEIDVSSPCIKSIGTSMSKGFNAGWNRVGIRYTRTEDPTDPITIYNKSKMTPTSVIKNGILLLKHIPMDYMWNKYGSKYHSIIKEYNLDEGNILFAAYGKDRVIYSITHLLLEENQIGSK